MPQYGDPDAVIQRTGIDADLFDFTSTQWDDLADFIGYHLAQASDTIDRYCQRTFEKVEGQEDTVQGSGRRTLRIPRYPVISVDSVERNGSTVDADDWRLTDAAGMLTDQNAGVLKLESIGRRWRADAEYTITYDWGFEEPPKAVQSVAEELVLHMANEAVAELESPGAQSVSMDGYSITYDLADAAQKGEITHAQLSQLDNFKPRGSMVA